MNSNLSKASGADFVAIITEESGTYYVECFLRGPPPAPGFPSEMELVHDNSTIPLFPPMSFEKAKKIAIDLAPLYGFKEAEIHWE